MIMFENGKLKEQGLNEDQIKFVTETAETKITELKATHSEDVSNAVSNVYKNVEGAIENFTGFARNTDLKASEYASKAFEHYQTNTVDPLNTTIKSLKEGSSNEEVLKQVDEWKGKHEDLNGKFESLTGKYNELEISSDQKVKDAEGKHDLFLVNSKMEGSFPELKGDDFLLGLLKESVIKDVNNVFTDIAVKDGKLVGTKDSVPERDISEYIKNHDQVKKMTKEERTPAGVGGEGNQGKPTGTVTWEDFKDVDNASKSKTVRAHIVTNEGIEQMSKDYPKRFSELMNKPTEK